MLFFFLYTVWAVPVELGDVVWWPVEYDGDAPFATLSVCRSWPIRKQQFALHILISSEY